MKNIYLLLAFVFASACTLKAAHSIGAEIHYEYIGNNQYHVIVKFYRDCRGIALSSINIGYRAGTGGNSTSCGSGTLNGFVRTQINEVTQVCSTANKPCKPSNTSGSGEGIEEHVWEDTLDLSQAPFASIVGSSSCNELVIYAGQCCRSGSITTGPGGDDFWVTTTIMLDNIRKCANTNNSNPEFHRYWPMFNCCNQPIYASLGAIDTLDFDSISFSLVPALKSLTVNPVSYTTPFTYKIPAFCYCPSNGKIDCTPNTQTSPPSGFYLSPRTGDLIYTPIKCDEVAVIVVEATEWRRDTTGKMVAISKTIRDNMVITKDDCGYNNVPVISGNLEYKAAIGEKICATFNIEDKQFTPFQTKRDSLALDWQGSASDATWKITRDSNVNKAKLEFCWNVPKDASPGVDYYFSIGASDLHCSKPAISSRTFVVRVLEKDTVTVKITPGQVCSGVLAEATLGKANSKEASFKWAVTDSATGKFIANGLTAGTIFKYLQKGSYKLTLSVEHSKYIYTSYTGYFRVNTVIPSITVGKDQGICKGNSSTTASTLNLMKKPILYHWSLDNLLDTSQKTENYFISKVDTHHVLMLEALDSNACIARDTVTIFALNKPELAWTSTPLKSRCWLEGDFKLENMIAKPSSGQLKPGSYRIFGKQTQFGPLGLVDSVANTGYFFRQSWINNIADLGNGKTITENLTFWFKDSNGCENSTMTSIKIAGSPVTELQDKSYCQDNGSVFLDSLVIKPKVKFGTIQQWRAISSPPGAPTSGLVKDLSGGSGTSWKFYFGNPFEDFYAGNYQFEFKVTDQITGCYGLDTAGINIVAEPALSAFTQSTICAGRDAYDLMGLFAADGKSPDPAFSQFTLISKNGDTSKQAFGNAYIDGTKLKGRARGGNWSIRCHYSQQGCATSINSLLAMDYTPTATFTTTPASQTPVTSPNFNINNTSSIESGEALKYNWNFEFPGISHTSTGFAPQVNYPAVDAKYTIWLEASSNKGCADTTTQQVQVGKGFTSVSGVNIGKLKTDNRFRISGIDYQQVEMRVYDLSGKLLATTTHNEGIELPAGIYLYQAAIQISENERIVVSDKVVVKQE